MEKQINTRILQKHDLEENWLKAQNFVPKAGELIIYDADESHLYPRIKIGDGEKVVNDLPFISGQANWNQNDESQSDFIQGRTHWTEYITEVAFDGNIAGRPIVYLEDFEDPFIKLSDDYFLPEQLIGGSIEVLGMVTTIEAEDVLELTNYPACIVHEDTIFVREDFDLVTRGTWASYPEHSFFVPFVIKPNPEASLLERKKHKIDEKYLPDTPVNKISEVITLPYSMLKDGTLPADGINLYFRPEVSMITEDGEVPVASFINLDSINTSNGNRSYSIALGNPKLFNEQIPYSSSDTFCSFFTVYIEQDSISFSSFIEKGDIPDDNTQFIFNYDIYSNSNLKMLPAPLYLGYDLNGAISGLLDVPQLFESLLGGRQVYALYKGERVQIKYINMNIDYIGVIGFTDLLSSKSYELYYSNGAISGPDSAIEKIYALMYNGVGVPTTSTYAAEIGALYIDTETKKIYKCIAIEGDQWNRTYVWQSILEEAITYTEQTLTDEQKAQARANIGITGTGADGYTPVRGTDYWTDADKAEIKSYVDEAILGGAW